MTPAPTAPEYALARLLIAHLSKDDVIGSSVLREPWDDTAQAKAIIGAAQAYNLAVAVAPQPPSALSDGAAASGLLQANLTVAVFTVQQVRGKAAEVQATAAGRVLALCMSWHPEAAKGIPYAEAKLERAQALNMADFPLFAQANLVGTVLELSKQVNYKHYFKQ